MPEKANDILTRLFQIYNRNAIDDKNQIAVRTLQFIDDRLDLVTLQLDSVEKNIAGYKSSTSAVDLGSQASDYFSKVKSLDNQNSELDLKLELLNDINSYAKARVKSPELFHPFYYLMILHFLLCLINYILPKLKWKNYKV